MWYLQCTDLKWTFWPVIVSMWEALRVQSYLHCLILADCCSVFAAADEGKKISIFVSRGKGFTICSAFFCPQDHKKGEEGVPLTRCSDHIVRTAKQWLSSSVCTAVRPFPSTLTVAPSRHCKCYQLRPSVKMEPCFYCCLTGLPCSQWNHFGEHLEHTCQNCNISFNGTVNVYCNQKCVWTSRDSSWHFITLKLVNWHGSALKTINNINN